MTEQNSQTSLRLRIGPVSFLNAVPLVWGMLHGPQQEKVDLHFSLPSVCAEQVEQGKIQLGLVPVAEVARQALEVVPGVGICCLGAVRSILLFSRVPWTKVRTLATDTSSRTSVQLARIILREGYGVDPEIAPEDPVLENMLAGSDAALIIGDPALRITPDDQPYEWLDLGSEWLKLTRLPMVFAAWAGKRGIDVASIEPITTGSYEYGRTRIGEIVEQEYEKRKVPARLATEYLTRYIRYELGAQERKGMDTFLELAKPAAVRESSRRG